MIAIFFSFQAGPAKCMKYLLILIKEPVVPKSNKIDTPLESTIILSKIILPLFSVSDFVCVADFRDIVQTGIWNHRFETS